jgi:hypothetical protein
MALNFENFGQGVRAGHGVLQGRAGQNRHGPLLRLRCAHAHCVCLCSHSSCVCAQILRVCARMLFVCAYALILRVSVLKLCSNSCVLKFVCVPITFVCAHYSNYVCACVCVW